MKRTLTTTVVLGLVAAGFAALSLLVLLSRRHPWLVAKKLRMGALLLSLSGASIGCPTTTCYVPAPDNVFIIDIPATDNGMWEVQSGDTLRGTLFDRVGTTFSYALLDSAQTIIAKNDLPAADGIFDEAEERFEIVLPQTLHPGVHELRLYTMPHASVSDVGWYQHSIELRVIP